jgi:hypothetical protein
VLAKLVLAHKLTVRDPMAFEEGRGEADIAALLLGEAAADTVLEERGIKP